MVRLNSKSVAFLFLALGLLGASGSLGRQVKLVERAPDPHGGPRPARDARDVPLRTSLYFELGASAEANKVLAPHGTPCYYWTRKGQTLRGEKQRLTPQGGTTDAYGECTAIV